MGLALISFIQNYWRFAPKKLDDIAKSDKLVNNLCIPEHTKKFVYAIVEPETESVVYILSAQNLSKQSAVDAEVLIREVRPDVVVTQVAPSSLAEIRTEEKINKRIGDGGDRDGRDELSNLIPTSWFGVLKGCFVNKISKDRYESLAGSVLLKEIFGVGLHGHFFAAKRAAEEVGSAVFFIESPFMNTCADECDEASPSCVESNDGKNKFQALSSLVPQNVGSGMSSKQLFSSSDLPTEMVKSLVSVLSQFNQKPSLSSSISDIKPSDCLPKNDYQVPSFAQTVYPLLIDLHNVFGNLPSIETALGYAQRILHTVDKGETVDIKHLSEVQTFQIAVEGLRIGMNSAGRSPLNKAEKLASSKSGFTELSTEDKSHALFAQAIRSQTQNFKSVVAIVDANSLSGLRKHWNTNLPPEVKDLIKQFISQYEGEKEKGSDKKRLIPDKPVVAVGAGATAVLGASSLSKAIPLLPASFKLGLLQSQKALAITLTKILGPSKLVAPGLTTTGAKSSIIMKAAASSNKIRAITHSIRAYAQRTSISATRTAFYEIMRRRRFQPIGYTPWIKFGCSVSACAGLLMYGDGIECAVESMPVAPAIASLGRGLQNLHEANQAVRQEGSTKVQDAIQSLMHRFKNNALHNSVRS